MTDADAVLEHHLRGLDTDACRAFIADLWAERGFDVTVEGDLVLASRSGAELTLYPLGERTRSAPRPGRPVDVVVAPAAGPGAVDLAERQDARLLDAGDLREMLRYALDPERAAALCERHLGAPPEALPAPLSERARERLRAAASLVPSASTPALLVVVLAAVVVAGLGLPAALGGGEDGVEVAPATFTPTGSPATTPTGTGPSTSSPETSPPGVTGNGIEDLSALASAHREILRNRSYTLWFDRYLPRNGTPGGARLQYDVDIAVEGERYLSTTTLVSPEGRHRRRQVYHDGDDRHVADWTGPNVTYRPGGSRASSADAPDPFVLTRALVARYLSTPETDTTATVTEDGRTLYRVDGRGRPAAPAFEGVREYRVTAMVDGRGMVHELSAEFTVPTGEGGYDVTVEVTYGDVGETNVDPPPWYDREFRTNGTSDSLGSPPEPTG